MKKIIFMAFAAMAIAFIACDKNSNTEFELPTYEEEFAKTYQKIEEVAAGDYTVQLYAEEDLFLGYNRLYFLVKETASNEVISNYNIKANPMMDMGMHMHSSPNEVPMNPEGDLRTIQQNVVFIMPSTAGTWTLDGELTITEGDTPITFSVPVSVVEKSDTRMLTFLSEVDSAKLFLILDEPRAPVVGENDIVFGVYKKESMMSFPPVEDYTIEFEPEMPTMNHGSPNNVNPTHQGNGLHQGVVNFTMTGYWRINVVVKDASGNIVKEGISFDVNF